MHILDDIVTNIEETNKNFEESVINKKDKIMDAGKVFDILTSFFHRVEIIKEANNYKKLIEVYFS